MRYLPFVPSLAMGVVGVVWIMVRPMTFAELFTPERPIGLALAAGLGFGLALLALARALEGWLPSFRYAGDQMERALKRLRLPALAAPVLAAGTAFAEELLFRGALLVEFGLWPQAILFGVLHPAGRRGWSYPLFAFFAAAGFGYLALWSGTLWTPLVAHAVINLHGLISVRRRTGGGGRSRAP